jgi:phosphoribosylanthranilate isomerase
LRGTRHEKGWSLTVLVKICGITRLIDAELAVDWGAGALGFVFWPDSPRFIDPESARTIVATLPAAVIPVGVFVNQPREYVNDVAVKVALGAIQLHGDESVEYSRAMTRPVLKAIALAEAREESIDRWPLETMILLDVHDPVRRGGTGRTVDWGRASDVAKRRPVILAGGLTPENVGDAISRVGPSGIDVSSGVESSPGVKDPDKLKALFAAMKKVEAR